MLYALVILGCGVTLQEPCTLDNARLVVVARPMALEECGNVAAGTSGHVSKETGIRFVALCRLEAKPKKD